MTKEQKIKELNEQLAKCRANGDIAGFASVCKQIQEVAASKVTK